jgi:uncharacterized membrane protein YkvA (DUF1232 family)
MHGWEIMIGVAAALALMWLALVGSLLVVGRNRPGMLPIGDALRLLPDVIRLLRRLAADPALPRGVRVRLALLLLYLLAPVDLVPDFIPVVGYADDAIVIALALRSVGRRAGVQAIDRHWPGTADGLLAVKRLAGLPSAGPG